MQTSTKITLFPYSLVRYPGLDYHTLQQWDFTSIDFNSHHELDKRLIYLKDRLCEELYLLINQQTDDKARQQLINLKRLIYNRKNIEAYLTSAWQDKLPAEISGQLLGYIQIGKDMHSIEWQLSHQYQEKLTEDRRYLQELTTHSGFQKALLLSSPVLFEQLKEFRTADASAFKQKELRIEFSLMRYLTRMAYKTSPFSFFTFTGLAISVPEKKLVPQEVKGSIRLSNALFDYLITILKMDPMINEHLLVQLNKTVAIDGDKIHFLVNFNNVESFQSLPAKGLQLYLMKIKLSSGLTLIQLIKQVKGHVDEDKSAIKSYLLKLVSSGFLELGVGINGLHPQWSSKFLSFLNDTKPQPAKVADLINLFTKLDRLRTEFSSADSILRKDILLKAEQQIGDTLNLLEAEIEVRESNSAAGHTSTAFSIDQFKSYRFTAKQLFYEDCFTNHKSRLPKSLLKPFIAKVDRLLLHLSPLDGLTSERQKMTNFFCAHYGTGFQTSLLTFYHDYYFHFKKKEKEIGALSAMSEETETWIAGFKQQIRKKDLTAETLNLSPDNFPLPIEPAGKYAKGMFVQLFDVDPDGTGEIQGVINALLPGMGKVSGRFLSMFDSGVTAKQVEHNIQLFSDEIIMAELNDASTFNANSHPPLLKYEITLPGGNGIYPPEQQLPVNDLKVSYDQIDKELVLTYGSKKVYAFDLSLESFFFRSNLYQLLAHFNIESRPSLKILIDSVDNVLLELSSPVGKGIRLLPRIVYDDTVVIRRKGWLVKTSSLPDPFVKEDDSTYYIKLQKWRLEYGLPELAFVYLRKQTVFEKDKTAKSGLGDDYKPQYFSFNQPLMVTMLRKLLLRSGKQLYFEEVLPDYISGNMHFQNSEIKEYLIQWNKH
ncbi:lantibiotic dehydratase [Pedobacter mendelii]|uniref:Lantibiotic dehydratase N-terminal domain-containing protein n=1 Tax=Pedobacter mendelii TaxID=1908240 RepID=A0ABQ2BD17_9SPHI|nr:lantibiotic dehydratase [Pedobacter mendelii]GGI23301.1 hypothetical protein GCM10008119_06960 [Pedobacter mendelii]